MKSDFPLLMNLFSPSRVRVRARTAGKFRFFAVTSVTSVTTTLYVFGV